MEKELSPLESLQVIGKAMCNSRNLILRSSGTPLIVWGALMLLFTAVIYFLSREGEARWNMLWFVLPIFGYGICFLLNRKTPSPDNQISSLLGGVWSVFGAFALLITLLAMCVVPFNITLCVIILFGMAESISGVLLRNWFIIIAGMVTALAGCYVAARFRSDPAQVLVFGAAAVVLLATGLYLKIKKY